MTAADLLHVYQEGETFPREGVKPSLETVQRLLADGLIAEERPPEAPAETPMKAKKTRKGGMIHV